MSVFEDKTILITGISGFIGRHLSGYLIEKLGCKRVYGLDKLTNVNLPGCRVMCADLENMQEVKDVIAEVNPQVVYHLAANINPARGIGDFDQVFRSNVIGTVNLLSAIQASGVKPDCFVNFGTCEEYGNGAQPFNEGQLPDPVSPYSGTKAAVSMLCRMFYNLYGMPVITVRPSLVYGPGQGDRFFMVQAIKKLLQNQDFDMTGGEQTRDYIYVEDLVAALVEVSSTGTLMGEAVNVSSGMEYKLKDVVLKIRDMTGSRAKINFGAVPYRQGEIMRYACDNGKITSLTGWKPRVSLEEGLRKTIDYIQGAM